MKRMRRTARHSMSVLLALTLGAGMMPAYSPAAFAEECNGDVDAHEIHVLEELDGDALPDGINAVNQSSGKGRSSAISQSGDAEDHTPDKADNLSGESGDIVDLGNTEGTVGIIHDGSAGSNDADMPSNEAGASVGNKPDAGASDEGSDPLSPDEASRNEGTLSSEKDSPEGGSNPASPDLPEALRAFVDAVNDIRGITEPTEEDYGRIAAVGAMYEALIEDGLLNEDSPAEVLEAQQAYEDVLERLGLGAGHASDDDPLEEDSDGPITIPGTNFDMVTKDGLIIDPSGANSSGYIGGDGNLNGNGGTVSRYVDESLYYGCQPLMSYKCRGCKKAIANFIPDRYAQITATLGNGRVATVSSYDAGTLNGSSCLRAEFKAMSPGTTATEIEYYANFCIDSESGWCNFCSTYNSIKEDYKWYRYKHALTVIVNADYELNYELDGGEFVGSGADAMDQRVTEASKSLSFDITSKNPVKDGSTFKGWNFSSTSGESYICQPGQSVDLQWTEGYGGPGNPVAGTLSAIWEPDPVAPEEPDEIEEPDNPDIPVNPPINVVRPTNPPTPPKDPEPPAGPTEPDDPEDPDGPEGPDDLDDLDDPEDPAYPADPSDPEGSSDPEDPIIPDDPGKPDGSDKVEDLGDSKPDMSTSIGDQDNPSKDAPSVNPIAPAKLSGKGARLSSTTQLEAEKAANDLGATFADTGDNVKAILPIIGVLAAACGFGLACLTIRGVYSMKRKGRTS